MDDRKIATALKNELESRQSKFIVAILVDDHENEIDYRAVMQRLLSERDVWSLEAHGLKRLARRIRRENRRFYRELLEMYTDEVKSQIARYLMSKQVGDEPVLKLLVCVRFGFLKLSLAYWMHLLRFDAEAIVERSVKEIDRIIRRGDFGTEIISIRTP